MYPFHRLGMSAPTTSSASSSLISAIQPAVESTFETPRMNFNTAVVIALADRQHSRKTYISSEVHGSLALDLIREQSVEPWKIAAPGHFATTHTGQDVIGKIQNKSEPEQVFSTSQCFAHAISIQHLCGAACFLSRNGRH